VISRCVAEAGSYVHDRFRLNRLTGRKIVGDAGKVFGVAGGASVLPTPALQGKGG
jgi:hypothetical protein